MDAVFTHEKLQIRAHFLTHLQKCSAIPYFLWGISCVPIAEF